MGVNGERDIVFIKGTPPVSSTLTCASARPGRRKQLVIAGMKTEFCVDTTCRAASALGWRTVLISDAHSTMDNERLSAPDIIGHHNITLAGAICDAIDRRRVALSAEK